MTTASQDWLALFLKTQALLEGHFELSSGKHSNQYFQCALVLQYPEYCEQMAKAIAEKLRGEKITCVIGPALGGVTIAYELGRQLRCRAIFAERKEEKMQLRRGFSVSPGERVLLVEDVITTGGSVLEVAELASGMGAVIAGFACVVDRSGGKTKFSSPVTSLVAMQPLLYEKKECPLCREGKPLTKPGSKSFKAAT